MSRSQFWVRAGSAILAIALVIGLASSAVAGRFPLWLRSPASPASPAGDPGGVRPVKAGTASPSPSASQAASTPAAPPGLSLQQMAGQRVIYSYHGLTPPARLLNLISHGDAGGVIFFGPNISSPAQLAKVIAELDQANASASNPVREPLLLMTDQEGGLVRRLPGAPYLSELQIGESADPAAAAADAGADAGVNLRGLGMNTNLAPVLDVYRQPGDFDDQYQRSYSMNPLTVSEAGAAFVTAQQKGGVAATVKHFPGLGDAKAAQDTDNRPVRINLSATTLRDVDELPYQAAIKAGARLAMVSWANYPALDPRLPAGLSPTIIQGQLQERLGFTGVTITDALGAGALRAYGTLGNRTMLAGRAGMDALLCTAADAVPGWKCVDGLRDGYTDGALPKTAFKAQLAQLLELRESLPA